MSDANVLNNEDFVNECGYCEKDFYPAEVIREYEGKDLACNDCLDTDFYSCEECFTLVYADDVNGVKDEYGSIYDVCNACAVYISVCDFCEELAFEAKQLMIPTHLITDIKHVFDVCNTCLESAIE